MAAFPLAPERYLETITSESLLLADAAVLADGAAVPACPGWDSEQLLLHLGTLHRRVAVMVAAPSPRRVDADELPPAPPPGRRADWFGVGARALVAALESAGDAHRCWTLDDACGLSAFWYRRMAQETLMHRVDAEQSAARESSLPVDLAADGIDELLALHLPRRLRREAIADLAADVLLRADDADARWRVRLTASGVQLGGGARRRARSPVPPGRSFAICGTGAAASGSSSPARARSLGAGRSSSDCERRAAATPGWEVGMLEESRLSLEEAEAVIAASFAASRAAGHRGIAVVVTDKYGEVIAGARMDGLAPRYYKAAHRKSYTAAVFERDTADVLVFWANQEARGHRGPPDWNDPMFTTLPGGITVRHGSEIVGGIGVAGGSAAPVADDDFAEVAIAALGPAFRHEQLHHPDPGSAPRQAP